MLTILHVFEQSGDNMPKKKTEIEKTRVTLWLPVDLVEKIEELAKANYKDRNQYILDLLVEHVKKKDEKQEILRKLDALIAGDSALISEIKKLLKKYEGG